MKNDLVFEFLNSINYGKKDIMTEENEKAYTSYVINHFLSGTADTVMSANEMNFHYHLDKKLQYHYLLHSIRRGKRFSKWLKGKDLDSLRVVEKYYQVGKSKAREILNILSEDQIKQLSKWLNPGGTK